MYTIDPAMSFGEVILYYEKYLTETKAEGFFNLRYCRMGWSRMCHLRRRFSPLALMLCPRVSGSGVGGVRELMWGSGFDAWLFCM